MYNYIPLHETTHVPDCVAPLRGTTSTTNLLHFYINEHCPSSVGQFFAYSVDIDTPPWCIHMERLGSTLEDL